MLKTYFFALLTGLCLLLSPTVRAQTPVGDPETLPRPEETPWSHLVDSLTADLDKSALTTGILYDRALPLAGLHSFGVRRPDTTASAHLRQAYLELWMASYNRGTFRFTPDQLRERANRVVRHDSVPLAVLDYQFHWLDTLAVRDGLVSLQNGVLADVAGRSRSPYLLRSLTLAAPLLDTLRQATATFVLPSALLLTNRTRRVSSMAVDFGDDSATHFLLPGQNLTVTYPSSGRKTVLFTVQFNDGTTAQVRATMYVKIPAVANRSIPVVLANLGTVEARIAFRDYNSTVSLFGLGDVLAVLHNPASQAEADAGQTIKLRRPVIIMDGFDPGDDSKIFNGDNSVYNLLKGKHILDLLDDQHLQRDLIILNFPKSTRRTSTGTTTTTDVDGGADYIERNAFVLVELINRLKPMLDIDPATGQPYQFTIIGPSMGGLVSRYALAYMEKQKAANAPVPAGAAANYWEHNTATWLSFDAPQQGAVVPIGDQAFLSFFQGISESARATLTNTVNSPAAKQMLVHHILAPGNTPAGAPGFRDRFMLALRANGESPAALGYPVHLRRIALANGRLNGQGDFGTPCGKMFDVDASLRTGNAILATVLSTIFSPLSQVPTRIAACTARYAPAPNSSCTVFEGVINYSIYGYNVPGGFNYLPLHNQRIIDAGSQGSFDLAPGGSRDTQDALKRQAEAGGRYAGGGEQAYKIEVTSVSPNHCFIPTVSALGFQYQSMASYQNTSSLPNPYTNLLGRDLVCNNEIPFDDFYAPPVTNTGHVTVVDDAAVAFLIRELTPQTPTPVFTAASPEAFCPNGSGTFAVNSVCTHLDAAGQPVLPTANDWTLSGPAVFTATGTQTLTDAGTSQVVQATAAAGTVTLTVVARRAGALPSAPLVRTLPITRGELAIGLDPTSLRPAGAARGAQPEPTATRPTDPSPDFVCPTVPKTLRVYALNAPPPYTGTVTTHYATSTSSRTITVPGNTFVVSVGQYAVDVVLTSAASPCDGQPVVSDVYSFEGEPCQSAQRAPAAYPNPADAVLHLAAPETTGAPAEAPAPRTAVLYNAQGREVRRSSARQATQLPTADLPSGLYYLVVEQGGHATRSQIRVQH